MSRSKKRIGDEIVIEERESAIIDYNDIIDAAEVESENESISTFSGDCDGHSCEPVSSYEKEKFDPSDRNDVASTRDGYYLIELDRQAEKCLAESFDYYRAAGASRQVAAEKVAEQRRSTIDRLRHYYKDNWNYVYVMIQFRDDYTASCGGIESDCEEYIEEVKHELAAEIVSELERDGYTVENQPAPTPRARHPRNGVDMFNTSKR